MLVSCIKFLKVTNETVYRQLFECNQSQFCQSQSLLYCVPSRDLKYTSILLALGYYNIEKVRLHSRKNGNWHTDFRDITGNTTWDTFIAVKDHADLI